MENILTNNNINYIEALQEKNSHGETIVSHFTLDYDWSDDKIWEMMDKKVQGKKEFYMVLYGEFNVNFEGKIKDIQVYEKISDLQDILLNKSPYLYHVWYFNYEEEKFKCFFGSVDDVERVYMKYEIGDDGLGGINLYHYFGEKVDGSWSFYKVEDVVKFCEENKNLKLYSSKEELDHFYSL